MKLFLFLAAGMICAVAFPYLMYRSAMGAGQQAIDDQQAIAAFMAGLPIAIHYNKLSLSVSLAASGLLFCAPFVIIAVMHGLGTAGWSSFSLILLPFALPTWDALKRVLSKEPPLVLSADTLKLNAQQAEVAWPEIASASLEGGRMTSMTLHFRERTFRNSFFIPRQHLTLRMDNYRESLALLECLRYKIPGISSSAEFRAARVRLVHGQDSPEDAR
jgi:hypothetical protein